MIERWRPVIGFEQFYEVSSAGSVRRIAPGGGSRVGRILKATPNITTRYLSVALYGNGQCKRTAVQVLVCEAFHGLRPPGKFANHKDLNRQNNREDNLEWLTRKENTQHALATGAKWGRGRPAGFAGHYRLRGSDNGGSKVTWGQAEEIRALKGRLGARPIAKLFGISRAAVRHIHQGKNWLRRSEEPSDTFSGGYIPAALRSKVLNDGRCSACGSSSQLTVDHVIAKANGGLTVESNLQCLCLSCNSRKGSR